MQSRDTANTWKAPQVGRPHTLSCMPATATHMAVKSVVLKDAMPMAQAAPRKPSPRVLTSRWLTPTCSAATPIETNIWGAATRCAIRILFKGLEAIHAAALSQLGMFFAKYLPPTCRAASVSTTGKCLSGQPSDLFL